MKRRLNPEGNPAWPPSENKYIMVQKDRQNGPIYSGKVTKILSGNNSLMISLVKGTTPDPKKLVRVNKTDGWRYISEKKLNSCLARKGAKSSINGQEELLYDVSRSGTTLSNKYYFKATVDPKINVPLKEIIDEQDIDDFAFLSRDDFQKTNQDDLQDLLIDVTVSDPEQIEENIDATIKEHRSEILEKIEGTYKEPEDIPTSEKRDETTTIIDKLHRDLSVPHDILVVDQAMIYKFVDNVNTLRIEAEKIKLFLMEMICLIGNEIEQNDDKFYGNLRFVYYNGYIHIFRTDIPLKEVITHELLEDTESDPKLKILGEPEYGIPIRHNILKYVLFQNELQRDLAVDKKLLLETELVLSQEYIIALTPEPRYQLWCVIRLIKLWYADVDLQNNIRKIKLIVNQYRTRSDKRYNIHNGIRFSIGVYPRYGKQSASTVLRKIMYYFALYFQAIGWKNNPPSYFKIVNDLISYTNCSQSLKLYYRRISEMNGQKNNVFSKNYTLMNIPKINTDILEQYVELK
jgi:hypothetical protein